MALNRDRQGAARYATFRNFVAQAFQPAEPALMPAPTRRDKSRRSRQECLRHNPCGLALVLILAALLASPPPALATLVSGSVQLVNSRDPDVRRRRDYSGVVVWLNPVGPPISKVVLQPEPRHAQLIQKGKHFIPHVLAVPVGTAVDFPNYDPIFHNAFSNFNGQLFDVGLYPPGTSRTVVFKRAGIARVFCNIHPTMSAVIVVLNTPYFAVSNASGAFQIRDVPPGEYRLHVFHERATEDKLKALECRVEVGAAPVTLPPIVISETGYLPVPHKNKYGKDYPPVSDGRIVYPGAEK